MKKCSLNDFIEELKPWMDKEHILAVRIDEAGRFVVHFLDGTKNVYYVDDCNRKQVDAVLHDFKTRGVAVEE